MNFNVFINLILNKGMEITIITCLLHQHAITISFSLSIPPKKFFVKNCFFQWKMQRDSVFIEIKFRKKILYINSTLSNNKLDYIILIFYINIYKGMDLFPLSIKNSVSSYFIIYLNVKLLLNLSPLHSPSLPFNYLFFHSTSHFIYLFFSFNFLPFAFDL